MCVCVCLCIDAYILDEMSGIFVFFTPQNVSKFTLHSHIRRVGSKIRLLFEKPVRRKTESDGRSRQLICSERKGTRRLLSTVHMVYEDWRGVVSYISMQLKWIPKFSFTYRMSPIRSLTSGQCDISTRRIIIVSLVIIFLHAILLFSYRTPICFRKIVSMLLATEWMLCV